MPELPTREGRRRVIVEGVTPQVDGGRFPAKRVVGEDVLVEADVFCDGHDLPACELRYRRADERTWRDVPMEFVENDRWGGRFTVTELGTYRYTVRGWVDRFASWRRDVEKKIDAGADEPADLLIGAEIVERAANRAKGADGRPRRRA